MGGEEREREMMPDGTLNPLCWMAAFPGPFIPRADRLLTIQIRGFEMAESQIWKKMLRPANSLPALAPSSQGIQFSGRPCPVD